MCQGTSLAIQWLGPHATTAGGTGLITGWGTKIPHAPSAATQKKCPKHCAYISLAFFLSQLLEFSH